MAKKATAPSAERLGLREYARRRGVSLTAVQKAIKAGRLADSLTRGNATKRYPEGRVLIDPALADGEWEANTDAAMQREKHRAAVLPPAADGPGLFDEDDGEDPALPEGKGDGPGNLKLAREQALRTHYQAKLARLAWEERVGNLVSGPRVRTHAFRVAHAVKEAIGQISDRLAPVVAAESDADRCRLLLQEAHDRALVALADAIPELVEADL